MSEPVTLENESKVEALTILRGWWLRIHDAPLSGDPELARGYLGQATITPLIRILNNGDINTSEPVPNFADMETALIDHAAQLTLESIDLVHQLLNSWNEQLEALRTSSNESTFRACRWIAHALADSSLIAHAALVNAASADLVTGLESLLKAEAAS